MEVCSAHCEQEAGEIQDGRLVLDDGPRNEENKVALLKSRLNNNPPDRRLVTLVVYNDGLWRKVEDLPTEIYFDDFLTYFVDINTVPSQALLGLLARYAEDNKEK